MKNLLLILACVLLFSSCQSDRITQYELDEPLDADQLEQWQDIELFLFSLEPLITGFHGELFGDRNVTADGYFTGSENLSWFGDMIYANDDGSIIWSNREGIIFRLDSRGNKEKICSLEECRTDLNAPCGHLPLGRLVYSNGYLYFMVSGVADGVFVFRYDIERHEFEKIIEIDDVTLAELALVGRYLYVQAYNWQQHISDIRRPDNRVDFMIARIDLYSETAVVVYSNAANPDDFDKIGDVFDFKFIDNRIIMPVRITEKYWDSEIGNFGDWQVLRTGVAINTSTVDMRSFENLIEIENQSIWISGTRIYDGEIYFANFYSGLNRVNLETGEREILHERIAEFDIEGDFLYYIAWTEQGQRLYRVRLDYTRDIDFNTGVLVYEPEYQLSNWRVHNGYIYGSSQNNGRYRLRLLSESEPFWFYRY